MLPPPHATLEDLRHNIRVTGVHPDGPVTVVRAEWHGSQAVTLTYRTEEGAVQERMLFRDDEPALAVTDPAQERWSFLGDGRLFRLAAEARRIRLAHLFDPYLALESSQVRPLPHQIEAVYGALLPRQPLRFLLADDSGAGKTIMAGLYIKELMIRGALERCMVVAPGNLTVQWQEELFHKFGLEFEIVTKHDLDGIDTLNVFERKPLLIARIDQLARRQEQLEPALRQAEWDLVVVDEAHRMAAHFWGDEIRKTLDRSTGTVKGPTTRIAAVKLVATHAIATKILARRAGRHAQTATRGALLAQLAAELSDEGVDHVVIESRGRREDGRDRSVILDCFRGRTGPAFNYDWRTKAEPLLWYPDALAGTARELLTGGQSAGFSFLQSTLTDTNVCYVTD